MTLTTDVFEITELNIRQLNTVETGHDGFWYRREKQEKFIPFYNEIFSY